MHGFDTAYLTGEANGVVLQGADDSNIDKIFQHFFSDHNLFHMIPHNLWSPPTDVYETPDCYVIRVELPGIQQKNVSVDLNHNVLTIRGHRRDDSTDTKLGFHQMEIHYGYFEKVITLPHSIDPEDHPASYRNGFLTIRIGKAAPPASGRRQIKVEG